jgi:hypothetical protein
MVFSRTRDVTLALAAGLALADGSIVVLALPQLLGSLHTTVDGAAAVLAIYTAVIAAALMPAEALRRRIGTPLLGGIGLSTFAVAALGCALARSLPLMLIARAVQAGGGAGALIAGFELLRRDGMRAGGRLWTVAVIGGSAGGPALGGGLTQAFDWRAIFVAQIPIALAGAVACYASRPAGLAADPPFLPSLTAAQRSHPATPALTAESDRARRLRRRAAGALALLSASLTAVLFLLVLVIVAGWNRSPLTGALILSVLPLAALAATRIPGDPSTRAVAGSLLITGGVGALAAMVTDSAWWTIAPELAAGTGMGLALPALTHSLLPERTAADAARSLRARHVGITVALLLLAPVIATRLNHEIHHARHQEAAAILNARLNPISKLQLAGRLLGHLQTTQPRGQLDAAFTTLRPTVNGSQRAALNDLQHHSDQIITTAVSDTFRPPFLIAAAFAALAALLLIPVQRRHILLAATGVAITVPAATAAAAAIVKPPAPTHDQTCSVGQLLTPTDASPLAQALTPDGRALIGCLIRSASSGLIPNP